jgi:Vasohibin
VRYAHSWHVIAATAYVTRSAAQFFCQAQATFLGAYLTCDLPLERYPVSFRSVLEGHEHRHIVLAVAAGGRWGALGISRRSWWANTLVLAHASDELWSSVRVRWRLSSFQAGVHALLTILVAACALLVVLRGAARPVGAVPSLVEPLL